MSKEPFKAVQCTKDNYNEITQINYMQQDSNDDWGFDVGEFYSSYFKKLNIGDFVIVDAGDCVIDILSEKEFHENYQEIEN